MTAEQVLQEAIIDLQRQDSGDETRRLAEEAAQLLSDGRDIEARALIEKAQAISGRGTYHKPNGIATQELTGIERIAAKLTKSVTAAFTQALQDLQEEFAGQVKSALGPLETRLGETGQRMERIEQQHAALEEAGRATSAQVAAHAERIAALDRVTEDLSARAASAADRIDQHRAALQAMHERQTHRAAALNDALDAISRLREPKARASEASAG